MKKSTMILIAVVLTAITSIVLFGPNHFTPNTKKLTERIQSSSAIPQPPAGKAVEETHFRSNGRLGFLSGLLTGSRNFFQNPTDNQIQLKSKKFNSVEFDNHTRDNLLIPAFTVKMIRLGARHASDSLVAYDNNGRMLGSFFVSENKPPILSLIPTPTRYPCDLGIKSACVISVVEDERPSDVDIHPAIKQSSYDQTAQGQWVIQLPHDIFATSASWYEYVYGIKHWPGIEFKNPPSFPDKYDPWLRKSIEIYQSAMVQIIISIDYNDGLNYISNNFILSVPFAYSPSAKENPEREVRFLRDFILNRTK